MTIDLTTAMTWAGMVVLTVTIWILAGWGAWDIGARLYPMLMDAGTLTSCADLSLHGAECMALAQEGGA